MMQPERDVTRRIPRAAARIASRYHASFAASVDRGTAAPRLARQRCRPSRRHSPEPTPTLPSKTGLLWFDNPNSETHHFLREYGMFLWTVDALLHEERKKRVRLPRSKRPGRKNGDACLRRRLFLEGKPATLASNARHGRIVWQPKQPKPEFVAGL